MLYAPSSIYEQPWNWGGQDAADGARIEAAEVAAERQAGTGLGVDAGATGRAARRSTCSTSAGPTRTAPDVDDVTRDVDAIVIDRREVSAANAYRERILEVQISQHGFTVQSDDEDIVVFTRRPDES